MHPFVNGVVAADFLHVIETSKGDVGEFISRVKEILDSPFDEILIQRSNALGSDLENIIHIILSRGCHDAYEFVSELSKDWDSYYDSNNSELEKKESHREDPKEGEKKEQYHKRKTTELIGEEYIKLRNDILFEINSALAGDIPKLIILTGERLSGKTSILEDIRDKIDTTKYNRVDVYNFILNEIPFMRMSHDRPTIYIADNADVGKIEYLRRVTKLALYSNPCVILFVSNNGKGIDKLTRGFNHYVVSTPIPSTKTITNILLSMDYQGHKMKKDTVSKIISYLSVYTGSNILEKANKVLNHLAYTKILGNGIKEGEDLWFDIEDITQCISQVTGISIYSSTFKSISEIESLLKNKIIGQEEIISQIAKPLSTSLSGVSSTERPLGSYMFFGPSGVGKTEMAKTIANEFFGGRFHREDMNTYSEKHSVSRLIGSPPGYVGYSDPPALLTFAKLNNRGVVLFDEIEKADEKIMDNILNLIDTGTIRDSTGQVYDMKNFLFIFTSNSSYGSGGYSTPIGFSRKNMSKTESNANRLINSGNFRKEFIGRMSLICKFNEIDNKNIKKIAKVLLEELSQEFLRVGIHVGKLTKYSKEVVEAYDEEIGVRSMKNYIEQTIKPKIMEMQDE